MLAFILAIAAVLPQPSGVRVERVEMIERNWHYDDEGKLIFVQLIFWEADQIVRAWRMDNSGALGVHKDHSGKGYFLLFFDQKDGVMREVIARSFEDTWTQQGLEGDREVNNRERLPVERRRGLRK